MAGRVITMYSYKGGVGRSFAVANIAVILAQWGCRVLAVDFDIEAPGLNHYFERDRISAVPGVLGFIQDCRSGSPKSWDKYCNRVNLRSVSGDVYLMPASSAGGDYTDVVQQLDWNLLYKRHQIARRFEDLRTQWIAEFDIVLIDSRTGVTDFSGLTTVQLPDVLAFLFTANAQSLLGSVSIAKRAMEARTNLPLDRPALLPIPIPARFEQREEYDRAQEWRERFVNELAPFYDTWRPRGTDLGKLIDLLTIPYVPRWTFGEDLAALTEVAPEGVRSSSQAASYACETLAALFLLGFSQLHLLLSSRDEFIHAARSAALDGRRRYGGRKIFISYSIPNEIAARDLRDMLHSSYPAFDVFLDATSLKIDRPWSKELARRIEEADAYFILIGEGFVESSRQQEEVDRVLLQTIRSQEPKVVVPIVLPGGESSFASSKLANYVAVFVHSRDELESRLKSMVDRITRAPGGAFPDNEDEELERGWLDIQIDVSETFERLSGLLTSNNGLVKELGERIDETIVKIEKPDLSAVQKREIIRSVAKAVTIMAERLAKNNVQYRVLLDGLASTLNAMISHANASSAQEIEAAKALKGMLETTAENAAGARKAMVSLRRTVDDTPPLEAQWNRAKRVLSRELGDYIENIDGTISVLRGAGRSLTAFLGS
jgi:MinD-like ATPase involved in chromosome partitioning or flagellar assembly